VQAESALQESQAAWHESQAAAQAQESQAHESQAHALQESAAGASTAAGASAAGASAFWPPQATKLTPTNATIIAMAKIRRDFIIP